jgi:hypothetical protein
VQALVAAAGRQGVKVINLLVKQDEDGSIESGRVYYASRLAPAVPGYESFDVLRATLEAARPLGLRVRAWVPQFHDQVAARLQPAWAMQHLKDGRVVPYQGIKHPEYFVNPLHPEVQAYQLAILREITSELRHRRRDAGLDPLRQLPDGPVGLDARAVPGALWHRPAADRLQSTTERAPAVE